MENKSPKLPPVDDHSPSAKLDEALLAVCEKRLSCDLTLYRPILDRCVEISTILPNRLQGRGAEQYAIDLARAVVEVIRTYFTDVRTGLELATYVRYVLMASGFSDVDAIIRDSVYSKKRIFLSGDEFTEMNRQLGLLCLSEQSSRTFSVTFRPVSLFCRDTLNLNGLFTKRLVQEEARTLAHEQLKATKQISDADLIAHREEIAAKQQIIEAQAAELQKRKIAEHREFLRQNRY